MFSPYMGEDMTSIIRIRNELKAGGETINLPIVTRLRNTAVGSGTLVGAEEKIDNYGQRVRIDWARNAVVTNKAENQKDSADIFGEAKPLLSDWGKELQRDEIIAALMALPTETLPGTDVRVNGILYQDATATQRGPVAGRQPRPHPVRRLHRQQHQRRGGDRPRRLADHPRHHRRHAHRDEPGLLKRVAMNADPEDQAVQDQRRLRVLRRVLRHQHVPRSQDQPQRHARHQPGCPPARGAQGNGAPTTRCSRMAISSTTA